MRRLGDILAGDLTLATSTSSGAKPEQISFEPPACERCNDAGFVRLRRAPGDADFGKAVPCDCAQRESEETRLVRLQRYSNLGPLARVTFASLDAGRSPAFGAALEAARRFAAQRGEDGPAEPAADSDARWLLLWGKNGSGKTSLAAAMANDRIARGAPALYVVVPDLLDHLRAAYRKDANLPYPELFEQVRNAPFLILDDIDASNLTAWADEKLFQLINHRDNSRLPTVIVSAVAPDNIGGTMGSLLARVASVHKINLAAEVGPTASAGQYRQIGGMSRQRLDQFSFERFHVEGRGLTQQDAESLDLIRSVLQQWALEPKGWITLIGPTGTGKTHLAAAIALHRLARGDSVFFAVVPDLLDHLRRTYGPDHSETYDEAFDALREAQLLVLDDLGAHSTTPWAQEKLYQLFSYRYLQALPTLITSNVPPDDLDPRLASRLLDHQQNRVYEIATRDYRTGAPPQPVSSRPARARASRRPSAWDTKRW